MDIGCCVDLRCITGDEPGYQASMLMQMGFDYLELSLASVSALSIADFEHLCEAIEKEQIKVSACNVFFPGTVKLTGPETNQENLSRYLDTALARANRLGARVIVLGSSGSRNVPEHFPYTQAWNQLAEAVRHIADKAAVYGITVAVEPLNAKETNIIRTLAEGDALVSAVDRPNAGLTADYYHMMENGEDIFPGAYAKTIRHAHFAEPKTRRFPTQLTESCRLFLDGLRDMDYDGSLSLECSSSALRQEAAAALAVLRQA